MVADKSFNVKLKLEGITKPKKDVYHIKIISLDGYIIRRNMSIESPNIEEILKNLKRRLPRAINPDKL